MARKISLERCLTGAVVAALLWGGSPPRSWAGDASSMGFPVGPALNAAEQGTGTGESARRPPGNPVIPDWGPGFWLQEGGGPERNPFYSWPPRKKETMKKEGISLAAPSPGETVEPLKKEGTKQFPFIDRMHPPHVEWSRDFGRSSLERPDFRFAHQPVVVNGRLLLVSTRGEVVCLDAVTGVTLWRLRLPEPVRAPGVSDGEILYIATGSPFITAPHMMSYAQTRTIRRGTEPAHLYALSLATGKVVWRAPLPGPALGSPVLAGKTLWVATGKGVLAGFSTEKEAPLGTIRLLASPGWSAPLYLRHWLWISLEGPQRLAAVWPEKGRTVWALSSPRGERLVLFSPSPSFGSLRLVTLLLSVKNGLPTERMAILSAVTGHLFHEIPFKSGDAPATMEESGASHPVSRVYEGESTVTIAGQTAVAASTIVGRVMAVDIPSGHLFWEESLPGRATGGVTVAGLLCALPENDRVLLLDLATGQRIGLLNTVGMPAPGPPPIVGNTLYLAGEDGQVRALPLDRYRSKIFPAVPAGPGAKNVPPGPGPGVGQAKESPS
ncbi:MAG: PQQ-binding-like beta-propeller repeat protein [Leptospirillia bacterium]